LSDRVFVLSPPPSVLVAEIAIPLSQPRDQIRTRSDQKFLELRNRIHAMIGKPKEQVLAEDEDVRIADAVLELNKTTS
jgi:NitT/TauT family transport system ATP-binding protein